MEWVKESDQDLVMLFLDFEIAYDIVLQEIMKKLGFSNQWI